MIKSMTGFGKVVQEVGDKKISAEIRTLNSKQMDITVRLPGPYKENELEVRSALSKKLERGKVDCTVHIEDNATESKLCINKDLALQYHKQLKSLASELSEEENTNYLALLLKMPEVMHSEKREMNEEDWVKIEQVILQSADSVDSFRVIEGEVLAADLGSRIENILKLLGDIEEKEPSRTEGIRQRITNNLDKLQREIDNNRLEQEMIYYIEKIDFTEEKVRLRSHCDFFLQTMNNGNAQGKKLGFISQEIGREINTLGSKANEADIQKLVVQMKDELEKIKEQTLNVL